MAKSKKSRAEEAVKLLNKRYRLSFKKKAEHTLTDVLLLAALGEGQRETEAGAALGGLRSEFVDWNEVRVSSAMELEPVLQSAGIHEPGPRVSALQSTIEEIYQKYNTLTVDPVSELDERGREKGLRRLRNADAAAVEAGLLYGFDKPIVSVGPAVQRVTKRLGLLDPQATVGRQMRQIAPGLKDAKLVSALYGYTCIASEFCFARDPNCEQCPLLEQCEFGPKELEKRERARIAAEKRRQQEEEKERQQAEKRRKKMKEKVTKRLQSVPLPGKKKGKGKGKAAEEAKATASKKKATSKKAATKKTTSKKSESNKSTKGAEPTKQAATKKAATKQAASKKPTTKKAATKKTTTKKATTKKPTTKKPTTKKAATKKTTTKKAATKKSTAKKSATKKTAKKAAKNKATKKTAQSKATKSKATQSKATKSKATQSKATKRPARKRKA